MIVPQHLQDQTCDWNSLVNMLRKEYTSHWHKNKELYSRKEPYRTFREMWGSHISDQSIVEAAGISTVRWVCEDTVEYKVSSKESSGNEFEYKQCTCLRGILKKHVKSKAGGSDSELALQIFDHLQHANKTVFAYNVRGLAIFDLLTNGRYNNSSSNKNSNTTSNKSNTTSNKINSNSNSNSSRFYEPAGITDGSSTDLIFLLEYDIHDGTEWDSLDFCRDGVQRTFAEVGGYCRLM